MAGKDESSIRKKQFRAGMQKKHLQKIVIMNTWLLFLFIGCFKDAAADPFENLSYSKEVKPVVVIDPGHGGHDIGARGPENIQEKNVSMAFARALATCLEGTYTPILTRNDDYRLDIPGRASIANHHEGSLFLSIHTGGSFFHHADGVAIYYYGSPDRSDEESDRISDLPETDEILWSDIQNPHSAKSRILAETIRAGLSGHPDFPEIKIHEAPLRVLSGVNMPGILMEIGYLTNPVAEKKMDDKEWLLNFAMEICIGIDAFFKKDHASHLGLQ